MVMVIVDKLRKCELKKSASGLCVCVFVLWFVFLMEHCLSLYTIVLGFLIFTFFLVGKEVLIPVAL